MRGLRQLQLVNDRKGSVSIIFGLAVIMLFGVAGLAVDAGRAYHVSNKLGSVLDGAALAVAAKMRDQGLDEAQAKAMAQEWIASNMLSEKSYGIELSTANVAINPASKSVDISINADVRTFIGPVLGVPKFTVSKASSAVYGMSNVELGMMLDVSKSMEDFDKIGDLKVAVKGLLDVMYPEGARGTAVKVGLAPYSTSVNAGPFRSQVRSGTGNCVTERPGAHAFKDTSPKGNALGNKSTRCPGNEILPLASSKSDLYAKVDALTPGGATAGHLGIAWAWYLVSPNWADVWPDESKPAPYDDKNTRKAVILMTDGMFNTEFEAANGASVDQAQKLCANIKATGVMVFTVGFQAPADVLPTLKACASGNAYFFDAADGAALTAAFKQIAKDLTTLRLAK